MDCWTVYEVVLISILVFNFKRRAGEGAFPRFGDPTETTEGLFDADLEIQLVTNLPFDCAFYIVNPLGRVKEILWFSLTGHLYHLWSFWQIKPC